MKETTYRRIVTALFLVGIGKVLLLNNLNLLSFKLPPYVFTWQMLVIILGAYGLLAYRSLGGIVLILTGAYFIAPQVPEFSKYNIHAFWPAILIFLGIGIFVKSLFKSTPKKKSYMNMNANTKEVTFNPKEKNSSFFNSTVIFSGERKKLSSYEFKGATITTICGGLELDLTDCYLSKEGPNEIDLTVVCGGVSLKVSREWNIKTETELIMSGVEDQINDMPDAYVDPAAEVILKGSIVMGGIEIKRI